jgi:hypothetical protein
MKWILTSALIFLSLGYWLGSRKQESKSAQVVLAEPPPSQVDSIKEKFQSLTDLEIQEYYLLKNEQEKYRKADEILGKIVLLLLQDLGVRVSESTQKAAQEQSNKITNQSFNQVGLNQEASYKTETSVASKPLPQASSPLNPWVQNEKKLSEVSSPTEVAEYLNQVKIENFEDSLKQSKSFTNTNQSLSELTGRYKGAAQVVNRGKNTVWEIEMTLEANMRGPTLRGLSHILISENGKTFSNSKDSGEVMNFREFSGGSQATLIRASPSINFQSYYIKSREAVIGNVYQLNKTTIQYEYIGTFELRRE